MGKKREVLDLTEGYREDVKNENSDDDPLEEAEILAKNMTSVEKKKRLAKRLTEMIDKIDNLSNEVYHLTQRIDLLEKKSGIKKFE